MLATMHWLPNRCAASVISSGRVTAAVLMLTLSAPARSASDMSDTSSMPPPTVNGMRATRRACSFPFIRRRPIFARPVHAPPRRRSSPDREP
jgi:hypothetical protein